MTIKDLLEKNYFHDSFIKEIKIVGNEIWLSIIFSNWMQDYYEEGKMLEQELVCLKFYHAKLVKEKDFEFQNDTIIQAEIIYEKNIISGVEFLIASEQLGYETTFEILAESVEWTNQGEPDWSEI